MKVLIKGWWLNERAKEVAFLHSRKTQQETDEYIDSDINSLCGPASKATKYNTGINTNISLLHSGNL